MQFDLSLGITDMLLFVRASLQPRSAWRLSWVREFVCPLQKVDTPYFSRRKSGVPQNWSEQGGEKIDEAKNRAPVVQLVTKQFNNEPIPVHSYCGLHSVA
jgi:hypothetical protein